MAAGLIYGGNISYFNQQNYLEAQRQKLESDRALLDAYSYQITKQYQQQQPIRYGGSLSGITTTKSDKLDEDFFKVELPKLNQEN